MRVLLKAFIQATNGKISQVGSGIWHPNVDEKGRLVARVDACDRLTKWWWGQNDRYAPTRSREKRPLAVAKNMASAVVLSGLAAKKPNATGHGEEMFAGREIDNDSYDRTTENKRRRTQQYHKSMLGEEARIRAMLVQATKKRKQYEQRNKDFLC